MKIQKILILGATGKTGRRVSERLEAQGQKVRRGSRNGDPSFDWDNKSTWAPALKNMNSVYITYQPDLAVPGAREAIEEFTRMAVETGVDKIVLLSGKGEREAELCEDIVKKCGANWTIVRASWFNQNFSEGFFIDAINAGHVALPKTEAFVPYVDADDIADVVVKTLLEEGHNGQTYELTGPHQLTFKQAIAEIATTTNRDIGFSSITMDEYKNMLKEYGLSSDYIWLIGYLFSEVLITKNEVVTHDIEKVLGRKPITFTDYVNNTAQTGVWNPK